MMTQTAALLSMTLAPPKTQVPQPRAMAAVRRLPERDPPGARRATVVIKVVTSKLALSKTRIPACREAYPHRIPLSR